MQYNGMGHEMNKCKNYYLYLHGLPLANIPTLSSVLSELTLMLDKHIKATFKVLNKYKGKSVVWKLALKSKFQEISSHNIENANSVWPEHHRGSCAVP